MNKIGKRACVEARRWIGTPYQHQAVLRGAGTDCLGLLRGIWRALYGCEPERIPPYTMDWAEPDHVEKLWQAAQRHLVAKPIAQAATGDVLLFRMRSGSVAKHLGIQGDAEETPTFIHAYSGHGVIENALSPAWYRRVVARFEFPEEKH